MYMCIYVYVNEIEKNLKCMYVYVYICICVYMYMWMKLNEVSDIEEMNVDNVDDGFVVPHGYLSDNEGDAEDRCLINYDATIQRKVYICFFSNFFEKMNVVEQNWTKIEPKSNQNWTKIEPNPFI